MKKSIYGAFAALISAFALSSCAVDLGTEVGNDAGPRATIYQYEVSEQYDSDCDVALRIAVNNKTQEVYVFSELAADKAARIEKDGEDAYCDYVIKNGQKLTASVDTPAEVVLEKLFGENAITAVAVNGSKKTQVSTSFTGLKWDNVVSGTYNVSVANAKILLGTTSIHTWLQKLSTSDVQYRLKDLYGKGRHLVFNLREEDSLNGGKVFSVVPAVGAIKYGSGSYSARDVATWQGNDDYSFYNAFDEAKRRIIFYIQYYAGSSNYGYGYEIFNFDAE